MSKSTLLAVGMAGLVVGIWLLGGSAPPSRSESVRGVETAQSVCVLQDAATAEQYEALVRAREPSVAEESAPVDPSDGIALPLLASPVDAPEPIDVIRVLLEDEQGEPIGGIHARLTLLPGSLAQRAYRPALATVDGTWVPSDRVGDITATSDEHGELRFEQVPWMRRILIEVPAQGEFAQAALFDTTVHPRRHTLTLVRGGEPLLLRVERLPAEPQGVKVIVRRASGGDSWSVPISRLWAFAVGSLNADGRAVLGRIPPGSLVADVVVPDVGIWRSLPIRRLEGGIASVDLEEQARATVRGVLRGRDGLGVAGASLALAVRPYLRASPLRSWLRRGRTDAEGRFELQGVPVGIVDELYVCAEGYVAPRLLLEGAPLRPDEILDVPLQLIPACSVVGTVTDASGSPRAGVRVSPSSNTGMMLWDPAAAWTDGAGRYRIDGLPPGTTKLRVTDPGAPGRAEVEVEVRSGAVAPAPGAVLEASSATGRIEVQVVDLRGKPVSGAWIGHRSKQELGSGTTHTGPTGPDGRFVIEGIGEGAQSHEVWAYKQGAVSEAYAVAPADADARTAQVRAIVPPVGQVRGRVLRGDEPASGLQVVVTGTRLRAEVDERADFHLRGVPTGAQELRARSGDGRDVGEPVHVRVRHGESTEVVLQVPVSEAALSLRGRLVDADGRPLVGVDVHTQKENILTRRRAERTGLDGRFEVPVAGRGNHTLYSGALLLHPALSAATEPVDVVFDPRAIHVVEGRILDVNGEQVTAAQVYVTVDDSGRKPEAHVGGGFFRLGLHGLESGRRCVQVQSNVRGHLGREERGRYDAYEFQPDDSVLVTPRPSSPDDPQATGIHLAGFVVDETGEPVAGAMLTATRQGAEESGECAARSAEDGTFLLQNVPAGRLRLRVIGPPGFKPTREPLLVEPGAGPVGVVLPRTPPDQLYTARGRVLDRDDQPVPDAPLRLWSNLLSSPLRARTDADGRFAFALVPRGEVSVGMDPSWRAPGYRGTVRIAQEEISPELNDVVLRLPLRRRDPDNEHDVDVVLLDPVGEVLPNVRPSVGLRPVGDEERDSFGTDPFAFARGATRARILGVPAGRYRVEVAAPGIDSPYLPVEAWEVQVPCPPLHVQLERAAELHGRVEGEDLEGYVIRIWSHGGGRWVGHGIPASGAFAFHVDPRETVTVTVNHPERPLYGRLVDVTAADAPLRIPLDQEGLEVAGRIEGLVRVPKRYRFHIVGALYVCSLELDAQLGFRVQGVPPGEYRLELSSYDFDDEDGFTDLRQQVMSGDTDIVLRPDR